MIKYFCDEFECEKELSAQEIQTSLVMIGIGHYCYNHAKPRIDNTKSWSCQADDKDDFNAS